MTVLTIYSLRDSIPVAKQFLVLAAEHIMPVGAGQKEKSESDKAGKHFFQNHLH